MKQIQMCPSMRLRSLWYIGRTAKSNLLKRKARSINHKLPYESMTYDFLRCEFRISDIALYAVPCGVRFKLGHIDADIDSTVKSEVLL